MPLSDEQQMEIEAQRANAGALEEMLYRALPVLDHGFVRVIDYMR